jgi:hypothetical protein
MALLTCNLTIDQGATYRQSFLWRQGAAGSTPQDLTGYTARMQIRQSVLDSTVLLDMTSANAGIALGGASGVVQLYIAATATTALPAGQAVYDLEMVAPNGDVTRLLQGSVNISGEVTR